MKKVVTVITALLIVLIVSSCREDKIVFPENSGNGSIFVTSNPPGASILVGSDFVGKVTPDWLDLESGDYFISLRLEGYADTTLKINIDPEVKRYLSVRLKSTSN